jgi:hypothetical protein
VITHLHSAASGIGTSSAAAVAKPRRRRLTRWFGAVYRCIAKDSFAQDAGSLARINLLVELVDDPCGGEP